MAAPQIPNLNTLRSSGGGSVPRRGRPKDTEEERAANDKIVQGTDNDASVSRLSAVEVGYLKDPFAKAFVPSETDRWIRRFPIINRGTYVRSTAIDNLVWRFLSSQPEVKKQIISLGAGSDTRYFRLQTDRSSEISPFIYHELDFAVNTADKIKTITSVAKLNESITRPVEISVDGTKLVSPSYRIHPIDLRTLSTVGSASAVEEQSVNLMSINASLPTLLISECCLIYLEPAAADTVLDYFIGLFSTDTPLGLIIYEPISPFDSFGEVMVSNLAARGIVLQTLQKYHSLNVQTARLRKHRFSGGAQAADIGWLWENWITAEEKERIAGLEMVDEVEEWKLLARHYCVVWGWRGKDESIWERWKELQDNEKNMS